MTPDLSTLSLVELRQLRRAVAIAIGAVEAGGGWLASTPMRTGCPSSSPYRPGRSPMMRDFLLAAAIAAGVCAAAAADTAGPDEFLSLIHI